MAREPSTFGNDSRPFGEAVLWRPEANGRVVCDLCAHRCRILPGRSGVCRVRANRNGRLVSLVRDRLIAGHVDPIEKKPLFHFLPGTLSYSIATAGCNFRCRFCQNFTLSQAVRDGGEVPGEPVAPARVVEAALRSGCATLAYTYTEPTIFFETAEEVGLLARQRGLKNVFVTNGFLTPEAVERARAFLDAANVDLKGFDDGRYRKVCGASLKGVLTGLESLVRAGVWVEVTTLVVPGMNDSDGELRAVARYVADLGRHVPWHISRYHPDYLMDSGGPTPLATLERAWELGREAGLDHVYLGNVPGHPSEHTTCPKCGTIVLERLGFHAVPRALAGGRCAACGERIHGVFAA
ncbi:MAG: AmmeMemoRadiSam system radical SAM enzyme [Acidobacteriota bacterium]